MDPKFSILVPTRQRPDTLLATLATLIWHPGDDYEIVVADNFGDDEVLAVIQAVQQRHPRVKHLRSDRILPMAQNWERGLAACSGEYVSVLGDDDGFLPSTLDTVRKLVAMTDARVIAWELHTYWWPDTIAYWNRNRLYVSLGNDDVTWIDSRSALVDIYRDAVAFGRLPMIYNAFVHRDVINAVIDRFGGYFVPADTAPDVSSGIINLVYTNRYLYSYHPLGIRGNSRRSNGTAFWARSLGKEQQAICAKEEGRPIANLIHPSMTPAQNLALCIASIKLHMKDLLFPHDNELQIDLRTAIQHGLANLNNDPDAYDDNLAEILPLAAKIGFEIDPTAIPAKAAPKERRGLQGPVVSGSRVNIGINCNMANVFDVAGAARLADSMSSQLMFTPAAAVAPATAPEPARKAG